MKDELKGKDEGGKLKARREREMMEGDERRREDLRGRTKRFALGIIRLYSDLPKNTLTQVLGKQLLRSGTSVGAHYREAFRSRSNAEFVSKIEGGLQELEESVYWMELLQDSGAATSNGLAALMEEADQLTRILVTCVKKAKS